MRLDKFLSNENIGSRKAVGTLVRSGAVAVNGQAVRKSDIQIDPEKDEITVNGKPVRYSARPVRAALGRAFRPGAAAVLCRHGAAPAPPQ